KSVAYQPSGALFSYRTGLGVGADVMTTIEQSGALPRPFRITTSGASPNFSTGVYSYDGVGNIKGIGPDSSGYTDSFSYDGRSRLLSASYSQYGGQSYSYDRFGNLTGKAGAQFCQTSSCSTSNQIPGATYVRGDLTGYAGEDFAYDGLDRMTKAGPTG